MAKILDCDLEVIEIEVALLRFFRTNTLGKDLYISPAMS